MKYVAYYRVSTKKQGVSGLGLDSQMQTVSEYVAKTNGSVIAEFTEIESGRNNKRLELIKAIASAKDNNAVLIIAKLDRLSRNVSFIFQLKDSNVEFVAADLPDANTLSIGMFAVIAQYERELISERTKKALQSKKAAGFQLGSPANLTPESRIKSKVVRQALALENENNKKAYALIKSLQTQNKSLREMAKTLNDAGFKTSKGNKFYANSIRQLVSVFDPAVV